MGNIPRPIVVDRLCSDEDHKVAVTSNILASTCEADYDQGRVASMDARHLPWTVVSCCLQGRGSIHYETVAFMLLVWDYGVCNLDVGVYCRTWYHVGVLAFSSFI